MRAMDVMTTNVITVDPDTSVQALATLLSERAISGVPVVDRDNRLVGVATEGDLLHRAETGTERRTERRRSRWLDLFGTDQEAARDYVKAHGRTVREIMTREVISVGDTTELADIATLLETKRIKRVPVLRDGKLVGIVSRSNLIQALAASHVAAGGDAPADRSIRGELLDRLGGQTWTDFGSRNVIVRDGVVHLWGLVGSPQEHKALLALAEQVAGVKGISDETFPAY